MTEKELLNPYRETKRNRLQESAEDYTEAIADLIAEKGEARTCALAKKMGVSHVTALRTIKRLERDGFVTTKPHHPVFLTPKGKKVASKAKTKHELLYEFLLLLGVPHEAAIVDVEGIEHHISKATLEAIKKHRDLLRSKKNN